MLSNKIRELREGHKMTQQDLANLCQVAVPTISKWESGTTAPRLPMLRKLADIFQVDMNYLDETSTGGRWLPDTREGADIAGIAQKLYDNPGMLEFFNNLFALSEQDFVTVKNYVEFLTAKQLKKEMLDRATVNLFETEKD